MTLQLRNVSKRFPGVPAVDDVSFSAPADEITGYLAALS
jgi:ABC-type multidrug transport system ATPase subunit